MAGIDPRRHCRIVERLEERQPDDVIEMTMREIKVEVAHPLPDELRAETHDSGARIEDQDAVAAAHFHAGRVGPEMAIRRGGRRGAPPRPPDPHPERRLRHAVSLPRSACAFPRAPRSSGSGAPPGAASSRSPFPETA